MLQPVILVTDGVSNGLQNGLLSLFQVSNVQSEATLILMQFRASLGHFKGSLKFGFVFNSLKLYI